MAKCMAPLCHMGRWNECEGDIWKPCVTKMENEKKTKEKEFYQMENVISS